MTDEEKKVANDANKAKAKALRQAVINHLTANDCVVTDGQDRNAIAVDGQLVRFDVSSQRTPICRHPDGIKVSISGADRTYTVKKKDDGFDIGKLAERIIKHVEAGKLRDAKNAAKDQQERLAQSIADEASHGTFAEGRISVSASPSGFRVTVGQLSETTARALVRAMAEEMNRE